ncbi:hypothetical protein [Nostoc sp.]|uniref:hypothetical protein n=1 Tax=Nostoc sp. TaxID=1180 RepID=UPI002FF63A11
MTRYQSQREAIRHLFGRLRQRPTLLIKLRLMSLVGQFLIAQNSSHTSLRVGCGASSALAKMLARGTLRDSLDELIAESELTQDEPE